MKIQNYRNIYLALILVFTACSSSKPSNQTTQSQETYPISTDKIVRNIDGKESGTLILSTSGNPETFNPLFTIGVEATKALSPMYLSLYSYNLETYQYEPILVKSHTVSEDGLTYHFKLREGIYWSDGTPFSVDDILFTHKILETEETSGQRYMILQKDNTLPKVSKVDEHTLKVELKEVNVLFLSAFGGIPILPKHKWQKAFDEGKIKDILRIDAKPEDHVGTGPFIINKFVPDQLISYKKNPYYFAFDKNGYRLPYYKKLVRTIVPDMQTMLVKFRNGETDMHEVSVEDFDLLKKEETKSDFTVYDLGPSLANDYLSCLQHPGKRDDGSPIMEPWKYKLFSDKRFRQALSYAIDRKGLIEMLYHGRGYPFSVFSSPGNKTWYPEHLAPYPYDVEKAKTLLKDIGLVDTNNNGIFEYEPGKDIQITLHTNSENQRRIRIGNVLKEDFRKLGLQTRLIPMPFKNLVQLTDFTLNYDCYILGWGGATPPDPVMSKNVILSSGNLHDWHSNQKEPHTSWEAEIDKYMQENQTTLDLKKRIAAWHKIEAIWHEQQPQQMIAVPNKFVALKNKIGNAKPSPYRPYYEWNLDELYDKTQK